MKRCIVNVATGPGWYPLGQDRLAASLRGLGYRGDVLLWRDELPEGCPTHEEAPYAFKYWALEEARQAGYEVAVWCDSSCYFVAWPDALFGAARCRTVWAAALADYYVNEWTSDACLRGLSMTREEAKRVPMVAATCFGVHFGHVDGRELLRDMLAAARGGLFAGSWTNEGHQVSRAPGVQGHRHDQSVLSVVVHRSGIPADKRNRLFGYDNAWTRGHSIVVAAGM